MEAQSVGLTGELSFATVPGHLPQAGRFSGNTLDLGGVTRIDSAGAAFLLELSRRAQAKGHKLTLLNATPQTRELLRFFELDEVLSLAQAG